MSINLNVSEEEISQAFCSECGSQCSTDDAAWYFDPYLGLQHNCREEEYNEEDRHKVSAE